MRRFHSWGIWTYALFVFSSSGFISVRAEFLSDVMQMHGFLTQGFFHSSDNNVYGQSDDGISPGLTEIGVNLSYQALPGLTVAAQGLYRRAGDVDRGSVRLDFGLVDLTVFRWETGRMGIRGGRIKVPYGLYNETRDVSFTHPGILLAQGIYFDRSRSLFVSSDGGAFYAEHMTDYGDFSIKVNIGLPQSDRELLLAVLPGAPGDFDASQPVAAAQLNYEINDGEYILAVSFVNLNLKYRPTQSDRLEAGEVNFQPLLFSAQYNGEKFSLTGEYLYQWNRLHRFGLLLPNNDSVLQSWYLEGSYRFLPKWQVSVRYNELYLNKDDKNGMRNVQVGLPGHLGFAKDWMASLRWDVTSALMLRAEYHRINGTAWISTADNPDRNLTQQHWDLFGLQFSYRF
ncbi:MAG: hypothetical protein ACU83N_03885 [Gammaproteobacteria bacterium]